MSDPVNWDEFAESSPRIAARGRLLIEQFGIVFLATVRSNGAPRLHPVVPIFYASGLYTFISADSPKLRDLRRDPRYALHAPLGEDDEEFMLTGNAQHIDDPDLIAAVAAAASYSVVAGHALFEFRIATCLWTIWERVGQPGTRPVRDIWRVDVHAS